MSARPPSPVQRLTPRLMKAGTAAAYLDVGVSSFYRLVEKGRIPPGCTLDDDSTHRWWFREDLDDFAESLRPAPSHAQAWGDEAA